MNRFRSNPQSRALRGRPLASTLLAPALVAAAVSVWSISATGYAAEAAEPAATNKPESATSSPPDPEDSVDTEKTTSTSEVFIPTEDISEDFAVSFPVDI
jgi:hypothetical protein